MPRIRVPSAPVLALAIAGVVTVVTFTSRVPVGAGVYYDDGAYLGLARSLVEGDGYTYGNLPDDIPGVKYPPLYSGVLAAVWTVFSTYPENLDVIKGVNALLAGLAAGVWFLVFAGPGRPGAPGERRTGPDARAPPREGRSDAGDPLRRALLAAVAVYGFLAVPTLSITTALLSEPLFILLVGLAVLWTERTGSGRAAEGAPGEAPAGDPAIGAAVVAGLLAAAAFLARSVGIVLLVAVPAALWMRRSRRAAIAGTAAALVPSLAWLAWSGAHAGAVPDPIVGQYGSYLEWFVAGLGPAPAARLTEIAAASWGPLRESLEFFWIPRATGFAALFVLLLAGVTAVAGLVRRARRSPVLPLFIVLYLGMVTAWPYDPYRFHYIVLPILTLAVVDGALAGWRRYRPEFPAWGVPVGALAAAILVVNAVSYHVRGHVRRAWASPQTIPAAAYAPLVEWIRAHTPPDAVIASGLDPYIHWSTGRAAVPSWVFLADDYGRYDRRPETLAAQLDSILAVFEPGWVALILGDNKSALTLQAFAERHPDRARKVFEAEGGGHTGVIWRVAPPGERLPPAPPPGDAERAGAGSNGPVGDAGTDGDRATDSPPPTRSPRPAATPPSPR